MGDVSDRIGSDQIIRILDCHTKELGQYSVDNGKLLKVSAVIHFAF